VFGRPEFEDAALEEKLGDGALIALDSPAEELTGVLDDTLVESNADEPGADDEAGVLLAAEVVPPGELATGELLAELEPAELDPAGLDEAGVLVAGEVEKPGLVGVGGVEVLDTQIGVFSVAAKLKNGFRSAEVTLTWYWWAAVPGNVLVKVKPALPNVVSTIRAPSAAIVTVELSGYCCKDTFRTDCPSTHPAVAEGTWADAVPVLIIATAAAPPRTDMTRYLFTVDPFWPVRHRRRSRQHQRGPRRPSEQTSRPSRPPAHTLVLSDPRLTSAKAVMGARIRTIMCKAPTLRPAHLLPAPPGAPLCP
jgi:hypothetical protein